MQVLALITFEEAKKHPTFDHMPPYYQTPDREFFITEDGKMFFRDELYGNLAFTNAETGEVFYAMIDG
jgi:hypothetical protein